jgi:hypothetical protein
VFRSGWLHSTLDAAGRRAAAHLVHCGCNRVHLREAWQDSRQGQHSRERELVLRNLLLLYVTRSAPRQHVHYVPQFSATDVLVPSDMSTDPTICTVAFASFICRSFSKHHSVLMADDSVLCEAADHKVIMILSYFVVVFFAFGIPVAFGGILIKKARKYERCVRSRDNLSPESNSICRLNAEIEWC